MKKRGDLKKRFVFLFVLAIVFFLSTISLTSSQTISGCGTLSIENEVYTLTGNVSASNTCFTAAANNVTLDCNGYKITYGNSGAGKAFYSDGFNNTQIKNCEIVEGSSTTTSKYALELRYSHNVSVENVNISTNITYGWGIHLYYSENFTFSNSTISTSGYQGYGAYIRASPSAKFINNSISTSNNYGSGIYIYTGSPYSDNLLMDGNEINTLGFNAYGVYLYSSNYFNLSNNKIRIEGANGNGIQIGNNARSGEFHNNEVNSTLEPYSFTTSSNPLDFDYVLGPENLANGKPFYYLRGEMDIILDNANLSEYGQLLFLNTTNLTIINTDFGKNDIRIVNSTNINLSNNYNISGKYAYGPGIHISSSYELNILNNTLISSENNAYGLYLYFSENSSISDNLFNLTGSSSYGIILTYSHNSNLTENIVVSDYSSFKSQGSNYNFLENNSFLNKNIDAIWFYLSNYNSFSNNQINYTGNFEALEILYSKDNLFFNNTFHIDSSGRVAYITGTSTINNNFTKNTFISIGTARGIDIINSGQNNFNENELNLSGSSGFFVSGTTYQQYNQSIDSSNLLFGKPIKYVYLDYDRTIDSEDFSEYGQVIFAYCGSLELKNSLFYNSSLSILNSENPTIYNNIIDNNLSSITGFYSHDSSILNLTKNKILGKGPAVYIENSPNLTISENTLSSLEDYSDGLYLKSLNFGNISKNNISTQGSYSEGIYPFQSTNLSITNNLVSTIGLNSEALESYQASNSLIEGNEFTSSNAYSIFFSFSSDSIINNNTIINLASSSRTVYTTSSQRLNITNNLISASGSNTEGLYISYAHDSNVLNNQIDSVYYSLYNYHSSNLNFSFNNVTSSSSYGVNQRALGSNGNNGTFSYNNISGQSGFYFLTSHSNNLYKNNINSTTGFGIYLTTPYNNLTENTINTEKNIALYVTNSHNTIFKNNLYSFDNYALRIAGTNNTFYWNHFDSFLGKYVGDTHSSGNIYTVERNGLEEGNIYKNVLDGLVSIEGYMSSDYSPYYLSTTPYGSDSSQGMFECSSGCFDSAPLTNVAEGYLPQVNSSIENDTHSSSQEINFQINITDEGSGIKNYSLEIYNETDLVNSTSDNFSLGTLNTTFEKTFTFFEGVYNWFIKVFDWAGNQNSEENNTLVIDLTSPTYEFIPPTPENDTGVTEEFILSLEIIETNLANITYIFNEESTTFNSSNEELTTLGENQWLFNYTQTGLGFGESYLYYLIIRDLAGNENITETRIVKGNSAPSYESITTNPSLEDFHNLDPGKSIKIDVNITDLDDNLETVIFQYKIGEGDWINETLENLSIKGIYNNLYSFNLTLPEFESNVTFRFFSNDSLRESSLSSEYVIESYWDCDWTFSTNLDSHAGWIDEGNKRIGEITLINLGDSNYSENNCSLSFNFNYDLSGERISFDGSFFKPSSAYVIPTNSNKTINVSANFLSEIKEESTTVSIYELYSISPTSQDSFSFVLVSNREGPYLYPKISSSPSQIYLTGQTFNLEGYFRNLMGSSQSSEEDIAYDSTLAWEFSEDFSFIGGTDSIYYPDLPDNDAQLTEIELGFSDLKSFRPGIKEISLVASGYDYLGEEIKDAKNNTQIKDSINITFLCFSEPDGVYVEACGSADGDYVPQTIIIPGEGTSSSGGGGGGGAPRQELFETSADYQLVRGEQNEVKIIFENKDSNESLKDLTFTLTGKISRYIEIYPEKLDSLGPKEKAEVVLKIVSPTYIELGKQELRITLDAKKGSSIYRDSKRIALEIHEISLDKAMELLNESENLIKSLNELNLSSKNLIKLFNESNQSLETFDLEKIRDNHQLIKAQTTYALNTKSQIEELNSLILAAEKKGIEVSESSRLIKLAKLSLEREDFEQAYERAKDAQMIYALSVKGELGTLRYYLREYTGEISLGMFFLFIFSFGSYNLNKLRRIKNRIKELKKEDKIINDLIKIVQKECFKEKKISMEEYEMTIREYNRRLSKIVEEIINLENKRIHMLKFESDITRLNSEKKKIIELMKELQKDYMKKKKIETKTYSIKLERFNKRLSEIEERLANLEAIKIMKKEGINLRIKK